MRISDWSSDVCSSDLAGASGTGSIDVFAQTRADIQTERTYSSIAHNAMKWVPILNVVLTVVFYALFPVLFPLFLMPRPGPLALRGYVQGFFYFAAWGSSEEPRLGKECVCKL